MPALRHSPRGEEWIVTAEGHAPHARWGADDVARWGNLVWLKPGTRYVVKFGDDRPLPYSRGGITPPAKP
jgi:hypothetical protein